MRRGCAATSNTGHLAMQLLTMREAAEKVRVSTSTLKQRIAEGQGPAVTRLGRGKSRILIREDCLEEWIRARTGDGSLPG